VVGVRRPTYYVTCSRARCRLGTLCVGGPGSFRVHRCALPDDPEDILLLAEHRPRPSEYARSALRVVREPLGPDRS